MRRREFIKLTVGAPVAWPFRARAQQSGAIRRVGALMNRTGTKPRHRALLERSPKGSANGFDHGRNPRMRVSLGGDVDLERRYAAELVALAPDVILAAGTLSVAALQRVTRTLPIVFVNVTDPVGAGFVDSLAQPGGNTTGFMLFEYSLSGKSAHFLKQIAPGVTRVAVLRDPADPSGLSRFAAIQAMAQSLGVEVSPVSVGDADGIERAVTAFARTPNGGLIVAGNVSSPGLW